jgi:dihydroneopterin aldolase
MELKIHLKDIKLYGYHGVHPLENKVGLEFIIDLSIMIKRDQQKFQLTDTIDYESIFLLLKEEFTKTESLLENLGNRIIQRIHADFPSTQSIDLTIMKIGAPISNLQGKVGISISKTFYQV